MLSELLKIFKIVLYKIKTLRSYPNTCINKISYRMVKRNTFVHEWKKYYDIKFTNLARTNSELCLKITRRQSGGNSRAIGQVKHPGWYYGQNLCQDGHET